MEKQIAVIRGDGIGPEIVEQALRVLDAVAKNTAINLHTLMWTWGVLPSTNGARLCLPPCWKNALRRTVCCWAR